MAARILLVGFIVMAAGCAPRGIDYNAGNGAHERMEPKGLVVKLQVVTELTAGYGRRLAFAPDGERWAAAAAGAVHLWRGTEHVGVLAASSAATDRVSFSRDGARLLLSPYAYDLARGAWVDQAPLPSKLGPPGSEPSEFGVTAAAWAPDGDDLVVSASFGARGNAGGFPGPHERVVLLRGTQREPVDTLYEGDWEMRVVAIDDRFVAMGGRDVSVWSRAERRRVAELREHPVPVTDLAFSPDGQMLASIDGRGVLVLWDTARWTPLARIQTSPQSGLAVAFHPRLPIVATGGYDGVVRLWSVAAGAASDPALATHALDGWVQALAFDPSGTRLLAAASSLPARVVVFQIDATAS